MVAMVFSSHFVRLRTVVELLDIIMYVDQKKNESGGPKIRKRLSETFRTEYNIICIIYIRILYGGGRVIYLCIYLLKEGERKREREIIILLYIAVCVHDHSAGYIICLNSDAQCVLVTLH